MPTTGNLAQELRELLLPTNRVEEALGNATDLNTAYREGAFRPSTKPWLGYMMLQEEHEKCTKPVKLREPHFPAFREFYDASYQLKVRAVLHSAGQGTPLRCSMPHRLPC